MKDQGSRIAGPIVHLVPALFDSTDGIVGGAERYVFELSRHMADVTPTRLVTFGQRAREERIGQLQIRVIADPWFVRGQRSNPVSPAVLAEVSRASVVHCHQQHVMASSLAAGAARLLRPPRVLHRARRRRLGHLGLRLHRSLVSRSPAHQRIQPQGLRPSVGRPRSSGAWRRRYRAVLAGAGASTLEQTMLFVGRMLPHKGINDLIDAIDFRHDR